jgi:nicotinate-nucleotide adenylyltransferase
MDLEKQPIGLLGGSFDPIHHGHLQLARDALKHLPIVEVHFIPAAQPWQKAAMTPAEHRAKMVQLAIADEPRFVLDMREIERGGTTFTIDTLRDLRDVEPERPLVLIMGSDQFAQLHTWRDWQQVAELAHIAVAQRAEISVPADARVHSADPAQLSSSAGGSIVHFPMTPVDASATEVRRLLREPRSTQNEQRVAAMVPAKVLDYIRQHDLYRAH